MENFKQFYFQTNPEKQQINNQMISSINNDSLQTKGKNCTSIFTLILRL